MIFEISFFLSGLLIVENGSPTGRISDRSARPTVVSKRSLACVFSPSGPIVCWAMRTWILACSSTKMRISPIEIRSPWRSGAARMGCPFR